MRLAILSRNKALHSIRRLTQEARKARIQCNVINPLDCHLVIDGRDSCIITSTNQLSDFDAVLPRIGASITDYGLAVVKHFETLGVVAINGSKAISESRDKMRSLQILAHAGLQVPKTVLLRNLRGLRNAVEKVNGMPVILKVLQGTQGLGVMQLHTPVALASVIETIHSLDQDVMIQQFIAEDAGRDYRAFVIGNRVAAAMVRTAPDGEFRSNIHRGGEGRPIKLSTKFEKAAIRAVKVLGLQIAGVDLMESNSGPVILEVNSSPGFEGVEHATGLNIAAQIITHIKRSVRGRR